MFKRSMTKAQTASMLMSFYDLNAKPRTTGVFITLPKCNYLRKNNRVACADITQYQFVCNIVR